MRRQHWVLLAGASVAGCGVMHDAFSAHHEVVARVGPHELTVEQMAEIFEAGPQLPLSRDVAERLARHWVDVVLIAQRAAAGDSLLDTASVLDAMWPDVRLVLISDLTEALFEAQGGMSPSAVDSAYRVGEARMLAHVLRRVPRGAPDEERERQRRIATEILERLRNGGSWEAANALSEDEQARPVNGSLGVVRRGETVPRFENAAFALGPGEVSPVTETEFGFHIIFRPRLEEIRPAFAAAIEAEIALRFDSAFGAELLAAKRVEVRPGAAAVVREVTAAPDRAVGSKRVIASYVGGEFTAGEFARWLQVLRSDLPQQLLDAPDDQIERFVRQMVAQELRWQQVDSAGMRLSDSLYATIETQYRGEIEPVWAAARIHPDSLAALGDDVATRERRAVERVHAYMEAIAARSVLLRPVQPFLAERLRREARWEIEPAGVARSLERVSRLRRSRDTGTLTNR